MVYDLGVVIQAWSNVLALVIGPELILRKYSFLVGWIEERIKDSTLDHHFFAHRFFRKSKVMYHLMVFWVHNWLNGSFLCENNIRFGVVIHHHLWQLSLIALSLRSFALLSRFPYGGSSTFGMQLSILNGGFILATGFIGSKFNIDWLSYQILLCIIDHFHVVCIQCI